MLTIHDRPFPAVDRSEAGHWEGDLIIGNDHLSAIGTLVERQTRMLRLVHLRRSDADSLHAALVARMQDLPPALMRSITWDQGTEMARHLATTDKLGAPVYFCDSRSPSTADPAMPRCGRGSGDQPPPAAIADCDSKDAGVIVVDRRAHHPCLAHPVRAAELHGISQCLIDRQHHFGASLCVQAEMPLQPPCELPADPGHTARIPEHPDDHA